MVKAARGPDELRNRVVRIGVGASGLRLDTGDIDWHEVTEILTHSYRVVAPKPLAVLAGG